MLLLTIGLAYCFECLGFFLLLMAVNCYLQVGFAPRPFVPPLRVFCVFLAGGVTSGSVSFRQFAW